MERREPGEGPRRGSGDLRFESVSIEDLWGRSLRPLVHPLRTQRNSYYFFPLVLNQQCNEPV